MHRVGNVYGKNNSLRIEWFNYSREDLPPGVIVIFENLKNDGVFAGRIDINDIQKHDKQLFNLLNRKGIKEFHAVALVFGKKLTMWLVSEEITRGLMKADARTAFKSFLKAFCLKNIKLIIINDTHAVFERMVFT